MVERAPSRLFDTDAQGRSIRAQRGLRWLHNALVGVALLSGALGVAIAVISKVQSASLPDVASRGGKFTEAASVLVGGLMVGAIFEAIALLAFAVAMVVSSNKLRTLWAGMLPVVYAGGFFAWQRGWLP